MRLQIFLKEESWHTCTSLFGRVFLFVWTGTVPDRRLGEREEKWRERSQFFVVFLFRTKMTEIKTRMVKKTMRRMMRRMSNKTNFFRTCVASLAEASSFFFLLNQNISFKIFLLPLTCFF